jgi:hypothetical protein
MAESLQTLIIHPGASRVTTVIACDKRKALVQGSEATKHSILPVAPWIASLGSMTVDPDARLNDCRYRPCRRK